MGDRAARNRQVSETLWQRLYARDFDGVGALFTADGYYADMPMPTAGATGPERIAARLRLGLGPLEAIYHHPKHMVAEGDIVVTEHAEEWHWSTGERVVLPFVSVHSFDDTGRIVRWLDYWDSPTLLAHAPAWWHEHVAKGY